MQFRDEHARASMTRTAAGLTRLAALRGLSGVVVEVDDNCGYIVNGCPCGTSVHGVYDWMNRQPGVKP